MKEKYAEHNINAVILQLCLDNQKSHTQLAFWYDRIRDMIQEVTWNGNSFSDIEQLSIPEDWPMNRSKFTFIRCDDNIKFTGYMKLDEFVVLPVKIVEGVESND